jgi:hypothetical protein
MPVFVNGIDVAATPSITVMSGRIFAPVRSVVVRLADSVETVDRTHIMILRGSRNLLIRLDSRDAKLNGRPYRLAARPYRAGKDLMVPLNDVVAALYERLRYDARHGVVAITVPTIPLTTTFTPAPPARVTPIDIFTPRPIKTPAALVKLPLHPRRTPIPVHLGEEISL